MAALRSAVLCMLAVAACMQAAAQAEVVYKTFFDVNPEDDFDLEYERAISNDNNWQTDVVKCPGGRRNLGKIYDNCLGLGLDWCKNKNAPAQGGCYRHEYRQFRWPKAFDNGKEYWLGTSIFMTENYKVDLLKTIHLQIKARGGRAFSPHAPSFILLDQYGYWAVVLRGSDQCAEECYIKSGFVQYLTPVRRNRWADFVFHIKFSYTPGDLGFIRVFLDGHIVFERYELYAGYNDPWGYGLFFKWGLYKHQWGEGKDTEAGKEGLLATRVESVHAAYVLIEGSDPATFHEADTRPGAGCSSIEECCDMCNPMFNEYRCAKRCDSAKGAAAALCQREMNPCSSLTIEDCCPKCVNGRPNLAYSHARCFKSCRAAEKDGDTKSDEFDEYCFETAYEGCSTGNPIQCDAKKDAVCVQEPYSTGCACPEGYHVNNKLGTTCQTSDGFADGRPGSITVKRRSGPTAASRRRRRRRRRRDSEDDDRRRRRRSRRNDDSRRRRSSDRRRR